MVRDVLPVFGDLIAVKLRQAIAEQVGGAEANGDFKRKEIARFPSHSNYKQIYA